MKRNLSTVNKFTQRNIVLDLSNEDNYEKTEKIGKALSSSVRLKMLMLIKVNSMSILEIASFLKIPVSSTAFHIKTLEEAGLVITETQPGKRGSMRVCIACTEDIFIDCSRRQTLLDLNCIKIDMPIGNYFEFDILPPCGLASEVGLVDGYDNASVFYSPNRTLAELLWFGEGFVEYRFSGYQINKLDIKKISFSMEICSEALGYREVWPSDMSILINDIFVLTYTSPGDFGNRRGHLTPKSWPLGSTQYGILKTFTVDDHGAYIDETLSNKNIVLSDLKIKDYNYISLKIMIKTNAKHIGGINIFGERFGDFPQGIVMNLYY